MDDYMRTPGKCQCHIEINVLRHKLLEGAHTISILMDAIDCLNDLLAKAEQELEAYTTKKGG